MDERLLSVEDLSKEYAPAGSRRLQRVFSRLGGITVDDDLFEDADDEDDLNGDDLRDDERPVPVVAGGTIALAGVSLTAAGGTCVGLVGPAGAGKSVLLKIVAGLVPPTRGRVVVHGLVAPALDAVVGALPKGFPLRQGLPVLGGMLRIPPRLVRRRLDDAFELLQDGDLGRLQPSSFDRRRRSEIVLATLLAVDPDVILLDLGMSRTDQTDRLLERVEALCRRGALVVAAAQRRKTLPAFCDRVVTLRRGRVVDDVRLEEHLGEAAVAPPRPKAGVEPS